MTPLLPWLLLLRHLYLEVDALVFIVGLRPSLFLQVPLRYLQLADDVGDVQYFGDSINCQVAIERDEVVEVGDGGSSECLLQRWMFRVRLVDLEQQFFCRIGAVKSAVEVMAKYPKSEVNEEDTSPNHSQHPILLLIVPKYKVLIVGSYGIELRQRRVRSRAGLARPFLEPIPGQVRHEDAVDPRHDRIVHRYVAHHNLRTKSGSNRGRSIELPGGYIVDLVLGGPVGLQHPRGEVESGREVAEEVAEVADDGELGRPGRGAEERVEAIVGEGEADEAKRIRCRDLISIGKGTVGCEDVAIGQLDGVDRVCEIIGIAGAGGLQVQRVGTPHGRVHLGVEEVEQRGMVGDRTRGLIIEHHCHPQIVWALEGLKGSGLSLKGTLVVHSRGIGHHQVHVHPQRNQNDQQGAQDAAEGSCEPAQGGPGGQAVDQSKGAHVHVLLLSYINILEKGNEGSIERRVEVSTSFALAEENKQRQCL